MDVQEFVTNVLQQLESSIADATKKSKDKRFLFEKSVSFDLAVTHTTNKEGDGGAKLKGGIKVIDFELGANGKVASGQQTVQRIQFQVLIWPKDDADAVGDYTAGSSLFSRDEV